MGKFKVNDFVKHKTLGQTIVLQIVNISVYMGLEEAPIYTCRYFANGRFYSEDFYEHELKLAEN